MKPSALRAYLSNPPRCPHCLGASSLGVHPAGLSGLYVGFICSRCSYAIDVLGILAYPQLAHALLAYINSLPTT